MSRETNYVVGDFVHCIKRGAFGLEIFRDESDYWRFFRLLYLCNDEYIDSNVSKIEQTSDMFSRPSHWPPRKTLCDIVSFVAMPNHFHLLLREHREGGIGKFMQRLSGSISMGFNAKYNNNGTIFQGKYKPVPIKNDSHLYYLIPYINVKNVFELYRHGGIAGAYEHFDDAFKWAQTYPFSSFSALVHGEKLGMISGTALEFLDLPISAERLPKYKEYAKEIIEYYVQKKKHRHDGSE